MTVTTDSDHLVATDTGFVKSDSDFAREDFLYSVKGGGFAAAGPGSWPSAPPGHVSSLLKPSH